MDLADPCRGEPGRLELAVDVAGEDERALTQAGGKGKELRKATVRHGGAVEIQPVAVEPPRERRIGGERLRTGDRLEPQAAATERRIGAPEPLRAAKVGQSGIDAHAGSGGDEQPVGGREQRGGTANRVFRPGVHRRVIGHTHRR